MRDTANGSVEFDASAEHGGPAPAEHNTNRLDANHYALLLTAKPKMQFDFLNERFLINTDLTSETSTPVDEFDVKQFIYDPHGSPGRSDHNLDSNLDHRLERSDHSSDRSSIDLKLATEHFQDYPSDDYLNLESELEEFEEANDELINLYASAISGLSIGSAVPESAISTGLPVSSSISTSFYSTASNVPSNTTNNANSNTTNNITSNMNSNISASNYTQLDQTDKIRLRKQVEDKVERFKQNSKNRFSQQIESSSVLLREQNDRPAVKDDLALLGLSRVRPDEMGMILDESDDYSSEEDPVGSQGGSLKRSLDAFSKQLSLLDERREPARNEANYQEKLNELSDWSIDTIVSVCGQTPETDLESNEVRLLF